MKLIKNQDITGLFYIKYIIQMIYNIHRQNDFNFQLQLEALSTVL